MSTLEERLHEALVTEGTRAEPSPDLFARVVASIDDDRSRRRRLARVGACWLVGSALVVGAVLVLTPRNAKGLLMPWWILEVGTNLALLAIALWLGPFIKRFGRAYAADVFHDNPLTGKSYIVLTDIVYYLIFAAYILFSVHVAPQVEWKNSISGRVTAEQVTFELGRLGGILLIIGILHGLNIVLMPLLGRIFSLNRRLPSRP
ncbi:hypothetical protein SAMN04489867_0212 [Pedococcus dokdonensis]|uniref:Uncharacterized protein n=1 Tax=Pedococcus dokdonensis TaxID=443156 RepID=A0A1H0L730_9MICO|nr:hypothetical protein [Pedococcus dokdonensis]SDO63882.1 hypothetical protein SAMN04489867_0212 [Pedococcus dokdonensis]